MEKRLEDLSVAEIGAKFRDGSLTSEKLTTHLFERMKRIDDRLHAFLTPTETRALDDARRADTELKAGKDRGPFQGIPFGLKDLYDTKGIRTTCQSRLRADVVPDQDAETVRRLAEAGGVLLGKLTTHEFAHGGPSFDIPWPPARNPWNTDHYTSGSSSGSAAGIAARMMRVATGSDTGGSIRGPAAFCGIVGLKPTYGRVSRRGVFPLSYTLDHCGPMGRSVEDTAILLQVLAGHDPEDPGSADLPVPDYRASLEKGVGGLRIGIPRHFFQTAKGAMPEVLAAIDRAADLLRQAGATVEDVTLPDYQIFTTCGRVILEAEAFAIHEQDLQTRPQDFGAITMERTMLGGALTAVDLVQAFRSRRELTQAVNDLLQRYDGFITAGALGTAPLIHAVSGHPSAQGQNMPWNVTGHPAMSVPTGLAGNGLPMSLTIVGRPFDEAMVLRLGRAVEGLTGWEAVAFPEF